MSHLDHSCWTTTQQQWHRRIMYHGLVELLHKRKTVLLHGWPVTAEVIQSFCSEPFVVLFITVLLGSKAEAMFFRKTFYIQTKMCRSKRKMTIFGVNMTCNLHIFGLHLEKMLYLKPCYRTLVFHRPDIDSSY